MKKINTLFKKNPLDLSIVTDELNLENVWVINGEAVATRKFDGTACAIIEGVLYKRYDVKLWKNKKGKIIYFSDEDLKSKIPEGAIACQEPDTKSGHWPHWIKCNRDNPEDAYHFEGFNELVKYYSQQDIFSNVADINRLDGTYELCGPKIQGNPEKLKAHTLIKHGSVALTVPDLTFEGLKKFLDSNDIEGIVFHHISDNRMCKIRKTDFKITRQK